MNCPDCQHEIDIHHSGGCGSLTPGMGYCDCMLTREDLLHDENILLRAECEAGREFIDAVAEYFLTITEIPPQELDTLFTKYLLARVEDEKP